MVHSTHLEEQLRLSVKLAADSVEYGGHVLAHLCPVRTVTIYEYGFHDGFLAISGDLPAGNQAQASTAD